MAQTSQQITKHCSHLIRTEIVRTEQEELPKTPLQAYMDPDSIHRHIHPWQQIIGFFVRTQITPDETHPLYHFNPRQHRAWETLWRVAVNGTRTTPDETMEEEDRTTPTSPTPPSIFHYRPLEKACLDFCLELLNQRIGADEYECALVCALAVISRSRTGW